jgi:hypothetical protein
MVSQLDQEELAALQRALDNLDCGDRIMTGKLQLFSLTRPEKTVRENYIEEVNINTMARCK